MITALSTDLALSDRDLQIVREIVWIAYWYHRPLPWKPLVEFGWASSFWPLEWSGREVCPERDVFIEKLVRLGLFRL